MSDYPDEYEECYGCPEERLHKLERECDKVQDRLQALEQRIASLELALDQALRPLREQTLVELAAEAQELDMGY